MRLLLVIAISISVVFSMSHTTSGLVELPQDGKHKQIAFNGYAFQLLYPKQNGSCTWRCSAQCGLLLNTTQANNGKDTAHHYFELTRRAHPYWVQYVKGFTTWKGHIYKIKGEYGAPKTPADPASIESAMNEHEEYKNNWWGFQLETNDQFIQQVIYPAGDKNVVQKQQKLWSKQGNRKCYLGKITKLEIYAYNGLCLRIIMLSLETQDASMIRKKLFEKTRCGAMDRVRCSFENNEWKHSNMTAVRQTIVLLDDMKVVQIVSEEQYGDKYTDWQCTFRRNQISGFMYAQKTLDDAKTVWKWMRKTREYGLCWATYANATKDSTAARLGLISSQPPDWAKFMAWKQSKPEIYKPMPSKQ